MRSKFMPSAVLFSYFVVIASLIILAGCVTIPNDIVFKQASTILSRTLALFPAFKSLIPSASMSFYHYLSNECILV